MTQTENPDDIVPGKFFVFTEVIEVQKYHTLVLDAADADAAKAQAEARFKGYLKGEDDHPKAQFMTYQRELRTTIKPMRRRHLRN